MTPRDDIRFLSTVDSHHGRFGDVPDGWFERSGFVTLSERSQNDVPLVAVNLRYPAPCPIDETADMQIVHWLANLTVDKMMLARAFVRSIQAIHAHMATVGATRVWGMVPKLAPHLTEFLDQVAASGACERFDGADVDVGPFEGIDMAGVVFYVGDGLDVTTFMVSP